MSAETYFVWSTTASRALCRSTMELSGPITALAPPCKAATAPQPQEVGLEQNTTTRLGKAESVRLIAARSGTFSEKATSVTTITSLPLPRS